MLKKAAKIKLKLYKSSGVEKVTSKMLDVSEEVGVIHKICQKI